MPRIPARIQSQGIGSYNPAATGQRATASPPVLLVKGPALALEQTTDRAQNQVQSNTRDATAQARANPFADGNLIAGVQFTNAVNATIPHGLGATYGGYFIVNVRGYSAGTAPLVSLVGEAANLTAVRIVLAPTGTFIADVWVYR